MMNWIYTKDRLPENGKYVLCRHNRGTWVDSQNQENVNCVVLKFVRGISLKERELLLDSNPKKIIFSREDESLTNKVPWCWEQFGPDSFEGLEIDWWCEISNPPRWKSKERWNKIDKYE